MSVLAPPNPNLPTPGPERTPGLNGTPNAALIEIGGICEPCRSGEAQPFSAEHLECLNYADYGLACEENLL